MTAAAPGRRERKKADTRRAIGAAALPLFLERGFEAVTLADIAQRADVSVKTIHNHFGSKEDIFFDAEPGILDAVAAALGSVHDGRLSLDGLCRLLSENRIPLEGTGWHALDDPQARTGSELFMATLRASRILTARWWGLIGRVRGRVVDALAAADVGGDDDQLLLGAMLAAVVAETQRSVADDLLTGTPRPVLEARVRRMVRGGLERVAAAFPDLVTLTPASAGGAG